MSKAKGDRYTVAATKLVAGLRRRKILVRQLYPCGTPAVVAQVAAVIRREAEQAAEQAAERERQQLLPLVYIGEHYFPENTYKYCLDQLVPYVRQLEQQVAAAEAARQEAEAEEELQVVVEAARRERDEARREAARLEQQVQALEERMRVVLHAGPSTGLATAVYDRCQRLERERQELRVVVERLQLELNRAGSR